MNRFVISVWLCLATSAGAQEEVAPDYSGSYLCTTTASGGVAPDEFGNWREESFDAHNDAYVVKVTDTKKMREWLIRPHPRVYNVAVKKFQAKDDFDDCFTGQLNKDVLSQYGEMECHHFSTRYFFDFYAMRFQIMFEGTYMDRLPTKEYASYISIGKCDKID